MWSLVTRETVNRLFSTGPQYNEAFAALLHSAKKAGAKLSVFANGTLGIEEVIYDKQQESFRASNTFLSEACSFKNVIFPSLTQQSLDIFRSVLARNCHDQKYVITISVPAYFEDHGNAAALRTMNKSTVRFLGTDPRVVDSVRRQFKILGMRNEINLFVPLFPLAMDWSEGNDEHSHPQFAIPAIVLHGLPKKQQDSKRMGYGRLISQIAGNKQLTANKKLKIVFVGNGDFVVPSALRSTMQAHTNLSYKNYYRLVCDSLAVMAVSDDHEQFWEEDFASVISALTCEIPLIATKVAMKRFSFLIEEAVIVSQGNATKAISKMLQSSEGVMEGMKIAMEAVKNKLMLQNYLLLNRLMKQSVSVTQFVRCKAGLARHSAHIWQQ